MEVTLHGGQSQQNSNVDLGQSCQRSQAKPPRAALGGWAPRLGSVSRLRVPPEKMCRGWKPSPSQLLLTASPLTFSFFLSLFVLPSPVLPVKGSYTFASTCKYRLRQKAAAYGDEGIWPLRDDVSLFCLSEFACILYVFKRFFSNHIYSTL